MAATGAQALNKPVVIAPAPPMAYLANSDANGNPINQSTMAYTCQTCAKRKVRCDKKTPICSSCRKGKLECFYQAPLPRRRKRNLNGADVGRRLAQYEHILRQHGLLPDNVETSPSVIEETTQEPRSMRWYQPETSKTGKIWNRQGKSRYIESGIWYTISDDEMQYIPDDEEDEEEDETATSVTEVGFASDPLTGAFMGGCSQSLLLYHPAHTEAMLLWHAHIENVEPLCKILHIPSTYQMVETTSQQPEMALNSEECLLFAIYHFAVTSMTEEQCITKLGQSRTILMQRYHLATRQALVNASFLQTTEFSVLQAFILFLLSCRHVYDPHTYWILTGVAVRIAQRMGIHRDGEKLGLPPFEVQMRRRIFYQILPLDAVASQMSGTAIALMPDDWDTRQPLNINDDQIWPGMTEIPKEKKGATEMIFCLARSCMGSFLVKAAKSMQNTSSSSHFKDHNELEPVICEAECEVEEKYIRYCDIVDPLHFLTAGLGRAAITAMRLRSQLPKVKSKTVTDSERRKMFQLALKILETDAAISAHPGLGKYTWHMKSFFVWGSWDSLIFVLTSLHSCSLVFSPAEIDGAWSSLEKIYDNHDELLQSKQTLPVAIGRLTLKAWDANLPYSSHMPEPAFIRTLRSLRTVNFKSRAEGEDSNVMTLDTDMDTDPIIGLTPESDAITQFGNPAGNFGVDTGDELDLNTVDWVFWEKLIHDHQAQDG